MSTASKVPIQLFVDRDLADRIRRAAEADGRTVAGLTRHLLSRHVAAEPVEAQAS